MTKILLRKNIYYDVINDGYVFRSRNIDIKTLPLSVGLQITRDCNLKCLHCSDFQRMKNEPLDKIKKILDRLKVDGLKRISFTGGEPLLRKDLVTLLEYAKKKNFIITLITNGTLLNQKKIKSIKPYIGNIRISIHGLKKYHDKFVGNKGSFKKAINAVKLCIANNISVSVVSSLVLSNVDELASLAKLICGELNIKKWRIFTLIARGRARDIFDKEFIHAHEIQEIYKKLLKEKNKHNWQTKVVIKNWRIEGRCLLILPNGSLIGVPSFKDKDNQYYSGNILKKSLELMWENYPYKKTYWMAKIQDFYNIKSKNGG